MDSESIGHKLAALDQLRDDPRSPESLKLLAKSLDDRSSRVVARAADRVGEAEIGSLVEAMLGAYRRLLVEPLKSDPGFAGKTAICRALVRLEHKDPDFYRAAIEYQQLDPVWGDKPVDSAAELRGIAAAGLCNCATSFEVLNRCAVLLADKFLEARCGAAHAIGILGHPEGTALLRLKLLVGDDKPEVMGACSAALLRLDRDSAVDFVSRFLKSPDPDICIQVALALAESRRPNVFEPLKIAWQWQQDSYARESILVCIGLLRSSEAYDFLLSLVDRKDLRTASEAIKLLKTYGNTAELRERVVAAVEAIGSSDLSAVLAKHWPAGG